MVEDFIKEKITESLPFVPNDEQKECIGLLAHFYTERHAAPCFLLKGYAGTGKTSIVSAMVKAMTDLRLDTVLLAPTGRAAKVLSSYAAHEASSIHKKIYRQKSASDYKFVLDFNKHRNTLFIVDEASMIGNTSGDANIFGSGRLLDDLIEYIYSGINCRMILLGDTAQLLPVGQSFSPALDRRYLESMSLHVTEYTLRDVVRQAADSGILSNATHIRRIIDMPEYSHPQLSVDFDDVDTVAASDVVEAVEHSYDVAGIENTIVITRSNKRANQFNDAIRSRILQREERIARGDLVMVIKNNYFWAERYSGIDFIANGDIAEIVRIRRYREMYGFRFVEVSMRLVDYDQEIDCLILVDSLDAPTPSDNDAIGRKLFEEVEKDYIHIGNKRTRYIEMRRNEYLNAIQIKFAYAITCHKSQGGQWRHVYVDTGYLTEPMLGKEFLQWLYTATTRCRERLFLVDFSRRFIAGGK